jgi:pimeloyl-ACP methyl ester carboxylesterase
MLPKVIRTETLERNIRECDLKCWSVSLDLLTILYMQYLLRIFPSIACPSRARKALEVYDKSSHDKVRIRRIFDIMSHLSLNKRIYRILAIPQIKIMIRLAHRRALNGLIGQLEAVLAHDAADRLRMIKAPTLVITGTEDRLIKPISSEVIASSIPKAKLVKVEGGSHNFSVEMRSELNREVLDFLKN